MDPASFSLNTKAILHQRPNLFASQNMQQALFILQLPILELSIWLEMNITQNPLLEPVEDYPGGIEIENETFNEALELDFEKNGFEVLESLDKNFTDGLFPENIQPGIENIPAYEESLFSHLSRQAAQIFLDPEERLLAELLLQNIDSNGFLQMDEEALKTIPSSKIHIESIIKKIQTFDPPGIAARDLKECLLLQLARKNLQDSLSYQIIEDHFIDFLEHRFFQIQKSLGCSEEEFTHAVYHQIKSLDRSPGTCFIHSSSPTILPDVFVHKSKGSWQVTINTKPLPKFTITEKYSSLLHNPEVSREEKSQFKKYLFSGKWLEQMIAQRTESLQKITKHLVKMQLPFFENEASIEPLSLHEVAQEISLHESTVARAIKDKYLSCPYGVFPIRKFFSNSLSTSSGEKVSTQSAKEMLRKMLENEDKIAPLSDKALAERLRQQGIICARRTVTKYRKQLRKPKASQRRYFVKKTPQTKLKS